eukprot:scaffold109629_cov59-Phaeocystis_antarctica.AAC.1
MVRCLYFANILALFLVFNLFTVLVTVPLITNSAGTFNQHYIACTGSGVGADDLHSEMSEPLKDIVRVLEQHTAEVMMATFMANVGTAITGHGLGLIGLFGIAIQEIADPTKASSDDRGDFYKRMSILATLVTTCLFYIGICFYIFVGLPTLSFNQLSELTGEEGSGSEFTKDLDFGLKDGATCWDENPWMGDFQDKLLRTGVGIQAILIVTNVILIIPSAWAYAPEKPQRQA